MIVKAAIRLYQKCPNIAMLYEAGAESVKMLRCIPSRNGQSVTQVFWLRCTSCSVHMLKRSFKKLSNVDYANFSRLGGDVYLGFVENKGCVCLKLGLVDEKLSQIVPDSDGKSMLAYLYLKSEKDLKRFLSKLKNNGGEYVIENVEPLKNSGVLTATQEKVLRLAYDYGFYDVPRRISISKLSRLLGISTHAISETIRRAHKKLVENYFSY